MLHSLYIQTPSSLLISHHTISHSSIHNNNIILLLTTSAQSAAYILQFCITMMMMMITSTIPVKHTAVASPISTVPPLSPSQCRSRLISSMTKAQLSDQRSSGRNRNGVGNRKLNFSWMATVGENVKPTAPVTPPSVPVRVAHELHQAGHRYLDVRTPEEFSAGHAVGAINVPYLLKLGSGMTKNPDFLEEVSAHFRKDDEIIVGCQLGKRSLMAATDLLSAGFTGVTDIAGGYAAWSQNGLPIES